MLFDSVHTLKKIYNNFTSRQKLSCPSFENGDLILEAELGYVSQIYNMELGQGWKLAHKLNNKVISPQPIEKCNVDLCLKLFQESTLNALDHYLSKDDQFRSFKQTTQVVDILKRFSNCINMNSNTMYVQKREDSLKPIFVNEREQIDFLIKFAEWMKKWETLSQKYGGGLSSETCHATY
uniref:Putative LOC100205425 [Hydra vulgaris] n=1 Tax=Lepeophtheirus salmonis TaxID=72036 RepID=A0A0K2UD24_LEPSM